MHWSYLNKKTLRRYFLLFTDEQAPEAMRKRCNVEAHSESFHERETGSVCVCALTHAHTNKHKLKYIPL